MRNGTPVFWLTLKKGALLAGILLMAISMIACSKKTNSDEKAGTGIKTEGNAGKIESKGKPGKASDNKAETGKAPDSKAEAGKSAAGGENSQVKQEKPNNNSGNEKKRENGEAASKNDENKSENGQEQQKKEQEDNKPEGKGKAQTGSSKGT